MSLFAIGDVYRGIDGTETVRNLPLDGKLLVALHGARNTIEQLDKKFEPSMDLSEKTRKSLLETDQVIRQISTEVNRHKALLGPARYVRWGNFIFDWLLLRESSEKAQSKQVKPYADLSMWARANTARRHAVACGDELKRVLATRALPTAVKVMSGEFSTSSFSWKRVLFWGATVGGAIFLWRYFTSE